MRGRCENALMTAVAQLRRVALPAALTVVPVTVGLLAGYEPIAAIALALGLAYALIAIADLYTGLALFVLLSFVVELPGLAGSGVTFAKVGGLLLAISWFAVITRRSRPHSDFLVQHPMVSGALVAFLGWVALSQLWADESAQALEGLFRLSLNALIVLIVFTAVRTPRQAIGLSSAFVAGATIAAVYGLLFVARVDVDETARLSGGLDNPNELAAILVSAMALALGLAAALRRAPLARIAAMIAAGLCIAGVFLTGSRGGLVALAVALLAFLVIGSGFRGRFLLVTAAVALAGLGYYNYLATPEQTERITSDTTGTGRTDLWVVGWRMVEDEPLHGIGARNFQTSSPHYLLEPGVIQEAKLFIGESPKVTHNTYLEIWAELGVVGLVLFLFVIGFGLYAAGKATRVFARLGDARMEVMAKAVFVAFAALLAADFFGSRQYNKELWILLGLAASMWSIARRAEEAAEAEVEAA